MKTQTLDAVLSWMRGTDLMELSYHGGAGALELRLEGAPLSSMNSFPSSRLIPVVSPGVGLFRFSAPGKSRRAEEGGPVSEGETLGIVETGGRSLPVHAGATGRILKILIEEGKTVEYGQPLFLIHP